MSLLMTGGCLVLAGCAGGLGPRSGRSARARLARVVAPGGPPPSRSAPGRRTGASRLGGAVCAVVVLLAPVGLAPPVRLLAVAMTALGARWLLDRLPTGADRTAAAAAREHAPAVLELLALALRCGLDPLAAAQEVTGLAAVGEAAGPAGSPGPGLPAVVAALQAGLGPQQAWARLAGTPLGALAAVMPRAASLGGAAADELDRLAARMRAEDSARRLSAVRAAGVSAVLPLGLCFLPAFLALAVVPVIVGAIGQLRL
jgi:hypothetical protein